jgi:hypothetical protein
MTVGEMITRNAEQVSRKLRSLRGVRLDYRTLNERVNRLSIA